MRRQVIGTICLSGMLGLLLWAPPVRAADETVKINSNMTFDPKDVPSMNVGDTITWKGGAGPRHHLYEGDVGTNEKELAPEFKTGTASHKFDSPYKGRYHCSIHSSMVGTIDVK
jgi:plastocyanin